MSRKDAEDRFGETGNVLAVRFGVSSSSISMIVTGKTWTFLPAESR